MSERKLLIPLAYINEATFASDNINEKKMKGSLEEAQEDLKDMLGVEFYEQIETQYAPANDTFSTANATLYEDYLKQFLAWQSYYYSMGFAQSDSTPTGQREFKDDNSEILSDVKQFAFEKNVRRRATKYKFAILNYLKQQQAQLSTNFPLYTESCKEELSFAISSVERGNNKDITISVNRAVISNE